MPTYSVTICPLRLSAHFCRPGGVYTVLISRRGVEIPTRPVVCNGSNEVVFADAEDISQCRSFEVSFDSPKDRRTLAFGIYDFTNRKNPAKLTGFEIPLAGMCSVLAGESMCESKGISFRVAGHPGKLDVIFRMHPLGTPVPALRALAARKDSNVDGGDGGDGGSGDQRATRLPTAALQALIKAGIMPTSVGALEMDVDLANEIAARTAILFPDKENLRAQIETLEKEVIRMEYDMKYGMKDAVASGSAAASALVNEHNYWKKKMEDIQEKSAHEAGLGPKLPPGASALPPQTQRAIAEVEKEMEENRAAMLKLDALQTKRDVTQDAMKLLRRGEELEAKLMKLKTSPNTNANGAASMGFDAAATGDHFDRLAGRLYDAEAGMEEVRQVVLALNGIQFSPYPAGTETGFTHEVPKELAFIAENHRRPQNLPPTLGGGAASAAPAAATKVTSPHANVLDDLFGGPSTNAAPTSPPPPPTKPLGDGGATISTLFEDGVYAGAPATKVAPVWQATDQQQQQQQQPDSPAELQEPHASPVFMSGNHTQGTFQASAIPEQPPTTMHGERGHLSPPPPSQPPMDYAQMQLEQMKRQQDEEKRRIVEKQQVQAASTTPHFERRPPTQEVIPFTSFPGIPLVVSACPIDVYLDGTTPTRGTEMSFINHADHQILIAGIELKQEDVFSPDPSSAKTVLTRRWPEQLQIPGASTRDSCIIALHSSFPRGTSLMMLVTVYLYEGDGKYSDHTTRLSV